MSIAIANTSQPVRPIFPPTNALRSAVERIPFPFSFIENGFGESLTKSTLEALASIFTPNLRLAGSPSVYNGTSITYVGDSSMDLNMKSIAKLDSFLNLPENWNGYGAKQFSPSYIEYAKSLLIKIPAKAEVFPISDGRVQFEFDKDNGAYLELEINSDKTIGVFEILDDKSEREYKTGSEETVRIVTEFYE